jgi:hypothetical protein
VPAVTNLPVPTWAQVVPGGFDTSALFNTVSNNGNFLTNPPIFSGYQSAAQSIGNNTLVAAALDTTFIDTYGGHSNVTNNSRYIPTVSGFYIVVGTYGAAANSTGNRFVQIFKNGTQVNLGQNGGQAANSANSGALQVLTIVQCNGTTDYVETYLFQNSGGALNTVNTQTGMQVFWLHA